MIDNRHESKQVHIIIDGSSYLFRAYHALPPLTNSKGMATGAIFGVVNMIRKLADEHPHDFLTVVFDAKGKTFRHDLYDQYKANRPPMPDDLREQIEPLHDVIRASGIPMLVVSGVEADDVIGTLAKHDSVAGRHSLISTTDKDLAQLVNDNVSLINTMSNTLFDTAGVMTKFGVRPDQIIDYLALVGDASDNIPGVSKVGPKTAVKLLNEFDTLDAIIDNAAQIKGKVGENIRAAADQLPLAVQLVTIKTDVDVEFEPICVDALSADESSLRQLYKELEFNQLLDSLGNAQRDGPDCEDEPSHVSYTAILTQEEFDAYVERLEASNFFSIDLETTSLNYMEAEIVGISFCLEPNEAVYIPVGHDYLGAPAQLSLPWVLDRLKTILESPQYKKLGQNLKYDMSVLANYDVSLRGVEFDTMLESYVLNSTASRHDMDSLAQFYLNYKTVSFKDIAGSGKKQLTFNQIELDTATFYAAEDVDIALKLHNVISEKLRELPAPIQDIYDSIEKPLIPILSKIERTGVLLDEPLLRQLSIDMGAKILQIEQVAHTLANKPFNLSSPKQIQEILFQDLGIPVLKKTPKGQPSTSEEVLSELSEDYELPRVILEYRSLSKLKSTYTDKLPELINARTGRVHTSYHQAVASTGRLSSSDPNLQNIPIKSSQGRKIREAFIAPPGFKIVAADYSQIELRIMAHLSGDPALLKAFNENADIHRATAAEILGIKISDVDDNDRRHAKAVNFGLIYGMSAFGLAKQLSISRAAAQAYIDRYFERYSRVKVFMEETVETARDNGFVETLFGRRLWLPDINAKNHQVRQYAERTAINAPMQGTAADLIKMSMIAADEWIAAEAVDVKMIMQVHDELVFEVPDVHLEQCIAAISKLMSNVATLHVPLKVDVGYGDNWNTAH